MRKKKGFLMVVSLVLLLAVGLIGERVGFLVRNPVVGNFVTSVSAAQKTTTPQTPADTYLDPAKTYAIIMEQDNYPAGMTTLNTEFKNTYRLQDMLTALGVKAEHMYIRKDNLTTESLQDAITWVENQSEKGDVVLCYLGAHNEWLQRVLLGNNWFFVRWTSLNDRQKILIVDACRGSRFINALYRHRAISISPVSDNELAWWGERAEGLPIVGSIWTYYFTEAIFTVRADFNRDGMISVEEAFRFADEQARKYMQQYVFAQPAFVELYRKLGADMEHLADSPHAVMYDNLPGQLIFNKSPKKI